MPRKLPTTRWGRYLFYVRRDRIRFAKWMRRKRLSNGIGGRMYGDHIFPKPASFVRPLPDVSKQGEDSPYPRSRHGDEDATYYVVANGDRASVLHYRKFPPLLPGQPGRHREHKLLKLGVAKRVQGMGSLHTTNRKIRILTHWAARYRWKNGAWPVWDPLQRVPQEVIIEDPHA